MTDELDKKENKGRIARWEQIGVDAIRADLEHSNGTRYVGRHRDLAWKWLEGKKKEEQAHQGNEDIMMLEPNFYGFGIRLKALAKWFKRNKVTS